MAKSSRMSLFVTRFVAYNLERYKDDPAKKALFTGLTESELTFETLTMGANGLRSTTIKSASRRFIGLNQSWTAADVNSAKAFEMSDNQLYPDLATLKEQTVPGVYAYQDADGKTTKICILLPYNTAAADQPESAKSAFLTNLKYETVGSDVTVDSDSVNINAPCIVGEVKFELARVAVFNIPDTDYGQLEHKQDAVAA